MKDEHSSEASLFDIDWTSIDDTAKIEILVEHVKFVDLSRQSVRISGGANSNIRSLLFSMLIALVMGMNEADNKTIVLAILGMLFARSIFSKLLEFGMRLKIESAKKELAQFMARKLGRRIDA